MNKKINKYRVYNTRWQTHTSFITGEEEQQQQRERATCQYYLLTVYDYCRELSRYLQSLNSLRMWKWEEEEEKSLYDVKSAEYGFKNTNSILSSKRKWKIVFSTYFLYHVSIFVLLYRFYSFSLLYTKTVTVKEEQLTFFLIQSYSWTKMKGREKNCVR